MQNFWQRLLLFAGYTESLSFVHTSSSVQGLSGRVKKSCLSHTHFSLRDTNTKDIFTNFENAHTDFNQLTGLFGGETNGIATYVTAKGHPEHLPAQELPQAPRDRILPRLQPSVQEITNPFCGCLCLQAGHDLEQAHPQQAAGL